MLNKSKNDITARLIKPAFSKEFFT